LPSQIAVAPGGVWVLNSADNTISQVDPRSGRLVATFAAGSAPVALAAGNGALWVGNAAARLPSEVEGTMFPASVTQLDPATRGALRTSELPHAFVSNVLYGRLPGQHELVAGAGSLWVIAEDGHVLRFGPAHSGRPVRLPFTADSLSFGGGRLWADLAGQGVVAVDPRSDRIVFEYPLPAGPGIAYGFGSLWVVDPVQGIVWRITPGRVVQVLAIHAPPGVTAVTATKHAVWASSVFANEVVRIDPESNRVSTTVVVSAPQDLAPAPGGVWVSTGPQAPSNGPLSAASCGPLVYSGRGAPRFVVASDLALDGATGSSTRLIAAGIEQLIRQRGFRAGRYTIGYQSCDDSTAQSGSFDWARCVTNARAYSADEQVIGIVGTYNSTCASVEIPILGRAANGPVALVSPTNTLANLTIPSLTGTPGYVLYPGPGRNYARVMAPEQIQYAADAVLEHSLGVNRVAVVDDGDPWARQSGRWFAHAAARLGLQLTTVGWSLKHPNPAKIARAVQATRADGVFVAAAGLPAGAAIVARLRAVLGPRKPIVVTDWFFPLPEFEQLAHGNVDGVYASDPGEPDSALPTAGRKLVASVRSKLSYTAAYGAGAAQVLLSAIARSNGTRASVARNLFSTRITGGVLGDLAIDPKGDPTPRR
jgi:branched-chain amino acid transport system substrate-binding protein